MKKEIEKKRLKKELKSLFRSMDYISDNFLGLQFECQGDRKGEDASDTCCHGN